MIRVCEFKMDGLDYTFKLASMTTAEAEKHVNEGRELLERDKAGQVEPQEWNVRARATVRNSMLKAGAAEEWTDEKIREEFDILTINEVFLFVLKISGLSSGEAKAASASPNSGAASSRSSAGRVM